MDSLRIGICDDEAEDLSQVMELVSRYDESKQLHIASFLHASDLLLAFKQSPFDIVILDIEMEPPTGFDIAKVLVSLESPPVVIFATKSNALIVSMTWAWGLCPGGCGSWMAKSAIMPLETNCFWQNSRTRTAYWSGGISLGMVSTHRLASWEFHCFSTASAAFHKVLRSAYSCGALGGSRISLWTIPRFSG